MTASLDAQTSLTTIEQIDARPAMPTGAAVVIGRDGHADAATIRQAAGLHGLP